MCEHKVCSVHVLHHDDPAAALLPLDICRCVHTKEEELFDQEGYLEDAELLDLLLENITGFDRNELRHLGRGEARKLFKRFDTDGNGRISYNEFVDFAKGSGGEARGSPRRSSSRFRPAARRISSRYSSDDNF